jgi:WhiB family transcriptional regulator, redox-sensing transcriptional regulator
LTISEPSSSTPWQNLAALFSALSLEETTLSSSPSGNITSWFFVDRRQVLPGIYERSHPDDWLDHAKCQGLPGNLFYSDHQHNNTQVQEAKSVCLGTHPDHPGRCPVLAACLTYAIDNGERWGVWGGTSERERRRIARARRQQHRDAAIEAGQVISLSAPTGDRQGSASLVGNDQEAHPTPWRCSKIALAAWRAGRAAARRTAPL